MLAGTVIEGRLQNDKNKADKFIVFPIGIEGKMMGHVTNAIVGKSPFKAGDKVKVNVLREPSDKGHFDCWIVMENAGVTMPKAVPMTPKPVEKPKAVEAPKGFFEGITPAFPELKLDNFGAEELIQIEKMDKDLEKLQADHLAFVEGVTKRHENFVIAATLRIEYLKDKVARAEARGSKALVKVLSDELQEAEAASKVSLVSLKKEITTLALAKAQDLFSKALDLESTWGVTFGGCALYTHWKKINHAEGVVELPAKKGRKAVKNVKENK